MPTIRIPTPLRGYTDQQSEIKLAGDNVERALSDLTKQYPAILPHLFQDGQLRSFVNIYLNKEDIRYLQGVATELKETDQLVIIPSIAGGAGR